ncbi:MAG: alpha-amylase family glycosyl hydrolase [Holophagales bacterium]|nr:alpha-amylase family glycosyl hydrolase [Holophagales bacterium]
MLSTLDSVVSTTRASYRNEPDHGQPRWQLPDHLRDRIKSRLDILYPEAEAAEAFAEIERLIAVHQAHRTPEVEALETGFDPRNRFTERDVILITYGDLLLSKDRPPLRTLADVANVFFHGLITTLHILPFFPYSSDRGFAVLSFKDVDPSLGSWDDIAELGKSFRLMFDGVFNHMSSESQWFREFTNGHPSYKDFFISFSSKNMIDDDRLGLILRPRTSSLLSEFDTIEGSKFVWTTFSNDQVDLNFKNPKVLTEITDILLFYVRHCADIIRLDAVTYLWYELGTSCAHLEETHACIKLMRDILDAAAPHVALITETNVPHADNVSYFGNGSDEAQMVYNFALPPLVVHAFQTADASTLSAWAGRLEYPSETTTFFNFLDSHDGIGVMGARGILPETEILGMAERVYEHGGFVSMKSNGDGTESPYEMNITWWSALNREDAGESEDLQIDRFLASRAIAMVLRGVPGLYLLGMVGARNDVEAVHERGSKRDINRTALHEEELLRLFADPTTITARIASRMIRLLERRTVHPAFHPAAPMAVLDISPRLFAVLRTERQGSRGILALISVSSSPEPVAIDVSELGSVDGELRDLIGGDRFPVHGGRLELTLGAYQNLWLEGRFSSAGVSPDGE